MGNTVIIEGNAEASKHTKSTWVKLQEVIWDGERSEEERKLVQKLDLYLM